MDKASQIVEETNALLDETDKLKDQRYASKDSIESAKQMKITGSHSIGVIQLCCRVVQHDTAVNTRR